MNRSKIIFLIVLACLPFLSRAQATIFGSSTICPNTVNYYNLGDDDYGCPNESWGGDIAIVYGWTISNGYFVDDYGGYSGYIENSGGGVNVIGIAINPANALLLSLTVSVVDSYGTHAGCTLYKPISFVIPYGSTASAPTGISVNPSTFCQGDNVTLTAVGIGSLPSGQEAIWHITSSATGVDLTNVNTSNIYNYTIPVSSQPNETFTFNVYTEYTSCPNISSPPKANIGHVLPPGPTATVTVKNKICSANSTSGLQISNFSNPSYSQVLFLFGGAIPSGYSQSNIAMSNADAQNAFFRFPAGSTIPVQMQGYDPNNPSAIVCPTDLGSFVIGETADDAAVSGSVTSSYHGSGVSCHDLNDGQIQLTGSGSASPFQYSLTGNPGSYQGGNSFSNLYPGSYVPYIKDNNGCVHSGASVPIANPDVVSMSTPSIVQPTCSGSQLTGNITISAAGGTSGLSYFLDGSQQGGNSFTASPGNHTVKVADANNCSVTNSVAINQPVTAGYTSVVASCATVGDGEVTVTASGGTNSFQYSLNGGAFQPSNIFSNQPSGSTYLIEVMDGNSCKFTISNATIGVKQPLLAGNITQTSSINCKGQTTAAFNVVASGGTSPYANFSWSNGTTGTSVSNVGAGTYTVTFKDSKGCPGSTSIIVNEPSLLTVVPTPSTFNTYNVSCKGGNNGSIGLTVTGGTPGASPPYTYSWTSPSWVTPKTTQNLSGLSAGSYSVTVKDGNNCSASASVTMTEPPTSVSVLQQSKSNLTCFGLNDGKITVTASGGVGALKYKDSTATSASAYQLNGTLSSLTADTHFIRAKDLNGCVAIMPGVIITSPTALSIALTKKTDPDCFGASTGVIQVSAGGGTGPYTFSDGGSSGFVSSSTFSEPAGNYIITVKDATNICTASLPMQVLNDPAKIDATLAPTLQSCSAIVDGKITVTNPTGGTGTLTYSISGDPLQSGPVFTGLAQGTYTVTIKDSRGCSKDFLGAVGIVPALTGTPTQTSFINCFGQSTAALSMVTAGGTSPYSYSWSTGAITQNIGSLPIGSYSVMVTDSKNCNMTKNITVTQPALLTASAIGSSYNGFGVSCQSYADGFINLTVSGGSSPYTYAWSNGANTKNISALSTGNYTVTVTDSKGCTANQSQFISSPTALALTTSKTNVTCNSGNDGSITANASGGAGTYSFSIDGGANWQSSAVFTPLTAGNYAIKAKDQNTCPATAAVTITQPTAITISIGTIQNAACGQADGSIQASASGGTGTLSYSWSNSNNQAVGNTANLSNVGSGTYLLTVTDQNSCTKIQSASVSNPTGPAFSVINQVATTCVYSADGQATVSVTSGPSPFSISWSSGETGNTAIHLTGGSNTVTVTDAINCSTTQNFTVTTPVAISLSNVEITPPTCPGGTDGAIQITTTGGSGGYNYQWNGATGTSSITGVAGNYDLQVTDATNCKLTQTISLADKQSIAINVVNQVAPTCNDLSDGSLIVQASGGNGSFSYSWNTGAMAAQLNSIGTGDYTVTAKDNKNCLQTKTITMTAPAVVSSVLTPTSVSCNTGSDGTINVNASGGTGSYSFSINNGNTWQVPTTFTGLTAGNYTVQTKDQNGCSTSSQTNVAEPTSLTISTNKIDPTCNLSNGSAQAIAAGGTGSYSYLWTNSVNQSQSTSTNLQAALPDTYTIKVTDANNCIATSTLILNSYPSAQFVVANVGSALCNNSIDASATLQLTFVQAPYTIAWSSGESTAAATKLAAGQNTVSVIDVNGCVATKTFQVPSPPALTAAIETTINPICAGGSDGSIQVIVTGGTGALSYSWNGTAGGNAIQNAKSGTYNLLVKDANNCVYTKNYVITDPTPFKIDLGADVTICPKTTTQIGMTLPNATYTWSGPNGFASTAGIVTVGDAGIYLLKLINAIGCQASDDIAISISNNLLKSDFLMVSEAIVGDTIAVIDISWPIPDQVEWHLGDSAIVYHSDNDYALIGYSEPGTYTVGVKATMGGCSDEYYQHITIDEAHKKKGGREASEASIESFVAYPNPFEGKTNLDIALSQVGNATIKVYCLSTNLLVVSHELEGEKNYDVELDLNGIEAGVYVVVLETGSKMKSVKVIKL